LELLRMSGQLVPEGLRQTRDLREEKTTMDQGFSRESSRLEQALRSRRGRRSQAEVAAELGIAQGTYSRMERGINHPVGTMAMAVATWLGWSEQEVIAASHQPGDGSATAPKPAR
jgi:transcriptional regulator with XRE-family HTH domain